MTRRRTVRAVLTAGVLAVVLVAGTGCAPQVRTEPVHGDVLAAIARSTDVSQAMLADPTARHTLLVGDHPGADAVVRAATAPAQATPEFARRAAELSAGLFTELAADPPTWRELVPRGTPVSAAVTDLAAARITDTAAPDTAAVATPNADGTYTAPLPAATDLRGLLTFVATGTDLDGPPGDREVQRLRTLAEVEAVEQLAEAFRSHTDPTAAMTRLTTVGDLIERSQYEALRDQGADPDEAAVRVYTDRTAALLATERILATPGSATTTRAAFDDIADTLPAWAPPGSGNSAAEIFGRLDDTRLDHRAYSVVAAEHRAGLIDPAGHPTLFTLDGTLRTFDDIAHQPGDPLGDLLDLVTVAPPGEDPGSWTELLRRSYRPHARYDPGVYRPAPDPDTPMDDPGVRESLRTGSLW